MTLEAARSLIEQTYSPPADAHPHPSEREVRRLYVSALTKSSAYSYAWRIINDDPYDLDPYWGFKGNALADAALAKVPHKEVHVSAPIPDTDWLLAGTMDGLLAIDNRLHPMEHKSGHVAPEKIEKAYEQLLTYGVLLDECLRDGQTEFAYAEWAGGGTFTLPEDSYIEGLHICFAPDRPPAIVESHPWDAQLAAQHYARIMDQSRAIIRAVEAGDALIAKEWDDRHPSLFTRNTDELYTEAPRDEALDALTIEYARLTKENAANSKRLSWLKGEILQAMADDGERTLVAPVGKFSIVSTKESEVPAKESYIRKAFDSLRFSPRKEAA